MKIELEYYQVIWAFLHVLGLLSSLIALTLNTIITSTIIFAMFTFTTSIQCSASKF